MKGYLIAILLLSGLFLTGCKAQQPTPVAEVGMLKGVSFSPTTFDGPGISDFFTKVKDGMDIVSWHGDWNDITKGDGAPKLILDSASKYGYTPIIVVQHFTQATGELLRPLDPTNRASYIASIQDLAAKYKPQYLGMGIEINILAEYSMGNFNDFVDLFNDAYDSIKSVSPNTQVFTIFELEHLKGLRGGLFGGKNDPSQAQWDLLAQFNKIDLIALSVYPGIIYSTPAEIPDNYISEVLEHTDKPIAITESGWFREAPTGWSPSTEASQIEFINRMFAILPDPEPKFIVWSFLYDQGTDPIFGMMGLLTSTQQTSAAWEAWKAAE
jgi:hypothetical protein